MSLPEDEQRQLQEIEQALYRDDPKVVRLMRATDPRVQYERKLMHALLWGRDWRWPAHGRGGRPPCLPGGRPAW